MRITVDVNIRDYPTLNDSVSFDMQLEIIPDMLSGSLDYLHQASSALIDMAAIEYAKRVSAEFGGKGNNDDE